MTWVTPSPESMTVPVSVLCPTCREVHDAARARTAWRGGEGSTNLQTSPTSAIIKSATLVSNLSLSLPQLQSLPCSLHPSLSFAPPLTCTAIYSPGTLKDSNIISAVYSLFSGVLSGGSVWVDGRRWKEGKREGGEGKGEVGQDSGWRGEGRWRLRGRRGKRQMTGCSIIIITHHRNAQHEELAHAQMTMTSYELTIFTENPHKHNHILTAHQLQGHLPSGNTTCEACRVVVR